MSDTIVLCYHAVSERWPAPLSVTPQAFASQLAFMKTFNVGYITDSMLVDIDGKTKLSL